MQKSIEDQNKEEMVVFLQKFGVEEKQYKPFLSDRQHHNLSSLLIRGGCYDTTYCNKERLPYDKTLLYRIMPSTSQKGCLVILVISGYFRVSDGEPQLYHYRAKMGFDSEGKAYLIDPESDRDNNKTKRCYTLKDFLKGIPYYIVLADYTNLTKEEYDKYLNKQP